MLALTPSSALMTDMNLASPAARGAIMSPVCSTTSPTSSHHVARPTQQRTRPKLSLDTSSASSPGYNTSTGSNSSSFRLETLSVISPTSRNTFQNTCVPRTPLILTSCSPRSPLPCPDIKISSPPTDSAFSPLSISVPSPQNYTHAPPRSPRSPRSPSSPRRNLPLDTFTRTKLCTRVTKPTKPKPIIMTTTTTTTTTITSPRPSLGRKRVSFRTENLTETIQTNTYITAHSSLLDSPSLDRTTMTLPSPTFTTHRRVKQSPLPSFAGRTETRTESRWRAAIERMAGETEALVGKVEREGASVREGMGVGVTGKRGSTSSEEGEGEDEDGGCPATPVVRSSKRMRFPGE